MAGRAPAPTAAQETGLAPLATQDLSLSQAQLVLDAAIAAAEEQGTQMDVAVVDAGGNLKAFARMDGAWLGTIDIAVTKARTARYFDLPTEALGSCRSPAAAVRHRGLQRRADHLPRRVAADRARRHRDWGHRRLRLDVENDRAVAEAGVAALAGANTGDVTTLPDSFDEPSGGGGLNGGVVGSRSGDATSAPASVDEPSRAGGAAGGVTNLRSKGSAGEEIPSRQNI